MDKHNKYVVLTQTRDDIYLLFSGTWNECQDFRTKTRDQIHAASPNTFISFKLIEKNNDEFVSQKSLDIIKEDIRMIIVDEERNNECTCDENETDEDDNPFYNPLTDIGSIS